MIFVMMLTRFLLFLFLFHTCLNGYSQLCEGSLGDPLVNISFGAGNNPGSPLAAAATGYQYKSGDCPDDGFYTVTNKSTACFMDSWHSLASDHTGNGNGYFMLVNASIQPSAFYVDTVRGLCGNSTYEFAAWVVNVLKPSACNSNGNKPDLTFTIETTTGTVLKSYNSGSIPPTSSPSWKQYGFYFTTPPAGSDIVLRIVNNAPGGCGNDLALDDITFRPCGPRLTPSVAGYSGNLVNICEGNAQTFNLSATISPGFTNPDFQWQQRIDNGSWNDIAGANSTLYTTNFSASQAAGTYDYRLSVAEAGNLGTSQCRISSDPITLKVNANPVVAVTNPGPVCEGKELILSASGGTQYIWSGPNNYSSNATSINFNPVSVAEAGDYQVTVTSAELCSSTGSTTVTIHPAPNASVSFTDTVICKNSSVQLSASGGIKYEWSPVTGLSANSLPDPIASPFTGTRYNLKISDDLGCTDTTSVNIVVNDKAIAHAGPDRTIMLGSTSTLQGSIEGAYSNYYWSPPTDLNDPQSLQPIANPAADAQYVLTVESDNDCGLSTDTMFIKLFRGIFVPNAFTPNNDGLNDTWNIPALDVYPNFELLVFNRYGEVVFENRNSKKPWNGSFNSGNLPVGAYVYTIKLDDTLPVLKGTVMIIR